VTDAIGVTVDSDASFDRLQLDERSWVDVARGWVTNPGQLFDGLRTNVAWQTSRLFRYDHWVEERRLGSMWRPGTPLPDPALATVHKALQQRYHVQFAGFSLIQYRDGSDGQAFHRDTDMRWLDDTVIAILSLGARRPWLLRPKTNRYDHGEGRGAVHDLAPGPGDLLVMGGACQAGWEHSVPYLTRQPAATGTRISLQWRHATRTGRPFMGSSYSAPLTYGRQ
jgi:alkylated DNA repair dioxygenase AlkB